MVTRRAVTALCLSFLALVLPIVAVEAHRGQRHRLVLPPRARGARDVRCIRVRREVPCGAVLAACLPGHVLVAAVVAVEALLRIVRGLVLELRERDYVAAAKMRGESAWYIMFVEILPNARGPLIVDSCLRMGYVVITIGVLGVLGLEQEKVQVLYKMVLL